MKKLVLIIAIIISPLVSFAQGQFDEFEDMKGVTTIVMTERMFGLINSLGGIVEDDPEAKAVMEMINGLENLKVFTTGDAAISAKMKSKVNSYLKSSKLDELMRIKDGEQSVKFYVKEGRDEDHVKELLMFVTGLKELTEGQNITINGKNREFETVILSLTGDIDLKQVSKLAQRFDLPGGEHLERTKDRN